MKHRYADLDGVRIFYRETGPEDAPTLLLLHGFPSASHQFRRLMERLGDRFHLIAPDYPGFGYSDAPSGFTYTFDWLADMVESFVEHLGIRGFTAYVFDFGAPVGFRLAERHPEWFDALIVQNGNAYADGLSGMARSYIARRPNRDGDEAAIRELLDDTRDHYLLGAADPDAIAPDGWTLDQHFLDLPGRKEIQVDLAFDYHSNVERYPLWQAWLREQAPPTLIVWGRNDPIFTEAGAHAYLRDVPDAELHLLDTGHFALEEKVDEIAELIAKFLSDVPERLDLRAE